MCINVLSLRHWYSGCLNINNKIKSVYQTITGIWPNVDTSVTISFYLTRCISQQISDISLTCNMANNTRDEHISIKQQMISSSTSIKFTSIACLSGALIDSRDPGLYAGPDYLEIVFVDGAGKVQPGLNRQYNLHNKIIQARTDPGRAHRGKISI